MPHPLGDLLAAQAAQDLQCKTDGMAGGAAGHDASAAHCGRGREDGALGNEGVFKSVEAGELHP